MLQTHAVASLPSAHIYVPVHHHRPSRVRAHACRCSNGHLYMVDGCGGCVERGACAECGVSIGEGSSDKHARGTARRVAARLMQEAVAD